MKKHIEKTLLGRFDKADFPELDLYDIDIKIDTGAYTSAIHCHNIRLIKENEKSMVHFNLFDPSHPEYEEKDYILPLYKIKNVKSSSGRIEERRFIKTTIVLFEQEISLELSLTDRADMRFPVLLGRKLLKNKFIVDVTRKNLSFHHKQSRSFTQ